MSVESHLDELVAKHRVLDRSIEQEMARPFADSVRVASLKKQKLHLKEEIERLRLGAAVH